MRPQRNEHDMTDYMSLEIFWANGAEYELMDEYIEDYGDDYIVDSEGTTALERRSKLDWELTELHKMETAISEKFGEWL